LKAGKASAHILELRYADVVPGAPELSPSGRRANREALRAALEGASQEGALPEGTLSEGTLPEGTLPKRALPEDSGDAALSVDFTGGYAALSDDFADRDAALTIVFADGVFARMDADKILAEDVRAVAEHMRHSKECVLHTATGVRSGSLMIGKTTYWIDCVENEADASLTITAAYSHRLAIEREAVWAGISRATAATPTPGHTPPLSQAPTPGHATPLSQAPQPSQAAQPSQAPQPSQAAQPSQANPPSRATRPRHATTPGHAAQPTRQPPESQPGADSESLICEPCNAGMAELDAEFSYLGRSFRHKALRCPVCGFVYVTEELARGRMREVEMALEDK